MVYDEYSPSTLMARLEQEYTFLKQETMTVQEYATKFIEKVRFAPDNVTTTLKINRFCSGLNNEIKILLGKKKGPFLNKIEALNEIIELALEMEDECTKSDKEKQASTSGLIRSQCKSSTNHVHVHGDEENNTRHSGQVAAHTHASHGHAHGSITHVDGVASSLSQVDRYKIVSKVGLLVMTMVRGDGGLVVCGSGVVAMMIDGGGSGDGLEM
uniref:Zinc/iron permease n=1 Tax=Tanacetum cinerariifolium TaxID=118510 RepID=A0A699I3R7_TANCI|nr:zinc/iron permease [Tanacetum cinerariifolium]